MNLRLGCILAITMIVVPSTWWITSHSSQLYQELHASERKESLQATVENSANSVSKRIETWKTGLLATTPFLLSADQKLSDQAFDGYLEKQSDFLSIQVFSVATERSSRIKLIGKGFHRGIDKRFGNVSPSQVERTTLKRTRSWLRKSIRTSKDRSFDATNFSKELKVPVFTFAFQTPISGTTRFAWIAVNVWQESLLSSMPKGPNLNSTLLTAKGDVVAAHDTILNQGGSYRTNPGGRFAISKPERAGTSGTYNVQYFASYAKIPDIGLIVLSEKNIGPSLEAMVKIDEGNLVFIVGFLVAAMLVGFILANQIQKELVPINFQLYRYAHGKFDKQLNPKGYTSEIRARLNELGNSLPHSINTTKKEAPPEEPVGSSLASHLRQTLLPQGEIKRRHLTISGYYQPAPQCGGALWGHKSLSETHELVYILDDSETGEPAALNMGLFHSSINQRLKDTTFCQAIAVNPSLFVSDLMEYLRNHPTVTNSAAVICLVIDVDNKKLRYCGTGPVSSVIVSNTENDNRQMEKLGETTTSTIRLNTGRDPITARGMSLENHEIDLQNNDRIVMFSRGLIETRGQDGETWGYGNLLASLQDHSRQHLRDFKDEVLGNAFAHYQSTPLADDIAFVAIECFPNTDLNQATSSHINEPANTPILPMEPPSEASNFGPFAFTESQMQKLPKVPSDAPVPASPPPEIASQQVISEDPIDHQVPIEEHPPELPSSIPPIPKEIESIEVPPPLISNEVLPPPPIVSKNSEQSHAVTEIPYSNSSNGQFSLGTNTNHVPEDQINKPDIELATTVSLPIDLTDQEYMPDATAEFVLDIDQEGIEESDYGAPSYLDEDQTSHFAEDDLEITLSNINPDDVEPSTTTRRDPAQTERLAEQEKKTAEKKSSRRYKIKLPNAG